MVLEPPVRNDRWFSYVQKQGKADPDDIMIAKCKYQAQLDEYKEFSKKFHLPEQRERIYADLKGRVAPSQRTYRQWQAEQAMKKATKAQTAQKKVEKVGKSGVHTVGKIDKNIYSCVTRDIITDEVIITDERIGHIKERHPKDYEKYCGYLKEIVENPRYIIKSDKPYTALILKEFTDGKERFKTVLRLVSSHDRPEYKNSIITFMKIKEREWERLLKNKTILYKSE